MKTKSILVVSLYVLGILSLPANATVSYGSYSGVNVSYHNVSETSMSSGDTEPLFGTPQVLGDSLIFTQMTFSSQASNGVSDITDGKLDMTIAAKNNNYIDKLKFQEFGDLTLSGSGTVNTKASVASSIFITILGVDNSSLLFPEFISVNMLMSDNGNWDIANGIVTGKLWNGQLTVDLTTILAQRGITGHATLINFSMDNTLATQSEINTSSYIAKKAAGLQIASQMIPEPATVGILGIGGLLLVRRR